MPYFMETQELKKHIIQYEKENKKLRIHLERIRAQNHKNMQKIRLDDWEMIEEEEEEEGLREATSIIEMEKTIKDLTWAINSKNREIEDIKMAKRNISDKALETNIEDNQKALSKYRTIAFKCMKRYKGNNEFEGMDREKREKYDYQNILLAEYEEMLKDLQGNIASLYKDKAKKQQEMDVKVNRSRFRQDKIEEVKDDIDYLFEKKAEMDEEARRRARFDKQNSQYFYF